MGRQELLRLSDQVLYDFLGGRVDIPIFELPGLEEIDPKYQCKSRAFLSGFASTELWMLGIKFASV